MPETLDFRDLPLHMAQNHVYLSVQKEDYSYASRSFLNIAPPVIPPKVVAVVGAGASNDACDLPTGEAAAKILIDAFKSKARVSGRLIDEEIHRITVEYRLESGDFEAVLLALSKFDQTTVLNELNSIYSRRHYPSLAYEVLAHWLKHRFIDAIVNFNFDELLDQAVDDELGSKGYYRVISDGDCPETLDHWLDKSGRFRFPLYIKPHGTASHKSTMRFTRSSYSLLPPDLARLLMHLFSGPVDVVVMGHAMQSVEFNDILKRSGGRELRFHALGHQKPELRVPDAPKWDVDFFDIRPMGGLGICIDKITSSTEALFDKAFKPRSIHRHRLIADLFQRKVNLNEEPGERERQREIYLRDRIYLEIALAISKAKGFVSLEHIARGRAGHYFRLLRRYVPGAGLRDSMLSMCSNLTLQPFGYSRETLCLPVSMSNSGRDRLRHPILPRNEFEEAAKLLAHTTQDYLSNERQGKCSRERLHTAFMEMYDGEEIEISNDTGAATNNIFSNPNTMATLTSLHAQTGKMLSSAWDCLLCIAESGKWLLRNEWVDEIQKRKAYIAIIVADKTHCKNIQECFGSELANRIRWLPWWLHNRHVTVVLKQKKAVQAIFFDRRLRTSHIAPLWLHGPDAEIALEVFAAYWIKAHQYEQFGKEIEIRPEQVRQESERLISDLYELREARIATYKSQALPSA